MPVKTDLTLEAGVGIRNLKPRPQEPASFVDANAKQTGIAYVLVSHTPGPLANTDVMSFRQKWCGHHGRGSVVRRTRVSQGSYRQAEKAVGRSSALLPSGVKGPIPGRRTARNVLRAASRIAHVRAEISSRQLL